MGVCEVYSEMTGGLVSGDRKFMLLSNAFSFGFIHLARKYTFDTPRVATDGWFMISPLFG
jgi:hypothetical protein